MRAAVARRLRRLASENASPEGIALSIALGLAIGVFPVYGCPTLMCLVVAAVLRPHVPLLHSVNLATSPLQLALILPFHRLGDRFLPPYAEAPGNWHAAMIVYGFTTRALTGWFLVCAPLGLALYLALAFTLRRGLTHRRLEPAAPQCAAS